MLPFRHRNEDIATVKFLSRWVRNGRPTSCFGCAQPFPHREGRVEAQVGADGKLYCYGTACDADAAQGPYGRWPARKQA
jgi:hypothetical protein